MSRGKTYHSARFFKTGGLAGGFAARQSLHLLQAGAASSRHRLVRRRAAPKPLALERESVGGNYHWINDKNFVVIPGLDKVRKKSRIILAYRCEQIGHPTFHRRV
jgi:hypothetical protein